MQVCEATNNTCEVRLEDIHAGYGKKEVLRGISLCMAQGELVALIGPNGSGKSTLLKVVSGFLMPLAGHVWLGRNNATAIAPYDRVKLGVSYFMQGGRVFPNLTVKENLDMGAIAVLPTERKENVMAVLDLFPNLRGLFGRRAGLLSGGQRQALALAMILVRRPRLLLLDEPSAGLSPRLVQDMLSKVHTFSNTWGTTILLVEQNIREALMICHRALVLVNGKIASETEYPKKWLMDSQLEQLFLGKRMEIAS